MNKKSCVIVIDELEQCLLKDLCFSYISDRTYNFLKKKLTKNF